MTHLPVMLEATLNALAIKPDGVYVDGTFGRGGHSKAILQQLGNNGRLWVFDKDPEAIASASALNDERVHIAHDSFAVMADVLKAQRVFMVDGVLLDLGVSSPQIDTPERGFSYRYDAPLDMRMDPTQGSTASEWLASADELTIKKVIYDYSEERFARQIAKKIVASRADRPISTTRELASLVHSAVKGGAHATASTARVFQAIRIHLNAELTDLALGLSQATQILGNGGRLAVISFHSLEDRIVKHFFRPPEVAQRNVRAARFLPQSDHVMHWQQVQRILCDPVEAAQNPRARSAVLRSGCYVGSVD